MRPLLWLVALQLTVGIVECRFRFKEEAKDGEGESPAATHKRLKPWDTDTFLAALNDDNRFNELAHTAEGFSRIRKCEPFPENANYKPEDYLGELHSMYLRYWSGRERPAKAVMRGGIPKIIHQSWKSKELPRFWDDWQQTWLVHNPDFEYHLWTDEGNRAFVAHAYPWFLCTYDSFPEHIMRVDSVRVLYMHWYGGVYSDLDTICLKPLRTLLEDEKGALVAQMGDDPGFSSALPNAWFASEPGHPFWLYAALTMQWRLHLHAHAEKTTGPDLIKDVVGWWPGMPFAKWANPLSIIPPRVIYPIDWHNDRPAECWPGNMEQKPFDVEACAAHFPEAYTMTLWQHSWGKRRLLLKAALEQNATAVAQDL